MVYSVNTWSLATAPNAAAVRMPAFATASPAPMDQFVWVQGSITGDGASSSVFSSPFLLPPGAERYYCASLARVRGKQLVLGITTYLSGGGHATIDYAMKQVYGGIEAYLWGGEFHIRNSLDTEAVGIAERFNPTSGFLSEGIRRGINYAFDKGLSTMQKVLRGRRVSMPFPMSPDVRFVPYDIRQKHLDPEISKICGDQSFRHSMGNHFEGLFDIGIIVEYGNGKTFQKYSNDDQRGFLLSRSTLASRYEAILTVRAILERDDPGLIGQLDGFVPLEGLRDLEGDELSHALRAMRQSLQAMLAQIEKPENDNPTGSYHLFPIVMPMDTPVNR